ncbi:peptidoglycan-binding protein [uncultured Roseibium sp.]|uniref:peptidoglycan-binding protein n=1 Tax=uncultured Roseibium sp. TaxID=1936171 RepID=UPI00260FE4FB|nr:peptidoglycan-binding protein [uncultured Roseibium sp.]
MATQSQGIIRLKNAAYNSPPMTRGERGEGVSLLQGAYVALGHAMPNSTKTDGAQDGIYGKETDAVTRHFQSKYGLSVDGDAGKETIGRLNSELGGALFNDPVPDPNGPTPNGPTPNGPVPPSPDPRGDGPKRVIPVNPFPTPPRPVTPRDDPHQPRFAAGKALNGFDERGDPPWQMVPVNGNRIVQLIGGRDLTVTASDHTVTVTEIRPRFITKSRLFLLSGLPGLVDLHRRRIVARDSEGLIRAQLSLDLVRNLSVKVTFHLVQDEHGGSRRSEADVTESLETANSILFGHANIHLHAHDIRRVDHIFGKAVNYIEAGKKKKGEVDEWDYLDTYRDLSADINVFFVNNILTYEEEEQNETLKAYGVTSGKSPTVLIRDPTRFRRAFSAGEVLAHEVGHVLGLDHPETMHIPTGGYGFVVVPVDPHSGQIVGGKNLMMRTISEVDDDNNVIKTNFTLRRGQVRQMHEKAKSMGITSSSELTNLNVPRPV